MKKIAISLLSLVSLSLLKAKVTFENQLQESIVVHDATYAEGYEPYMYPVKLKPGTQKEFIGLGTIATICVTTKSGKTHQFEGLADKDHQHIPINQDKIRNLFRDSTPEMVKRLFKLSKKNKR